MNLPFGLKQKPLPHYLENGLVKFAMKEGMLHYTVKHITKQNNAVLIHGVVENKTQLDQLISAKKLNDVIPTIEVVEQ